MSVKLLTEQHLEFLSSKGDWTGSSEPTLFKIPHCWKSRRYSFVMNSRKRVSSVLCDSVLFSYKMLISILVISLDENCTISEN